MKILLFTTLYPNAAQPRFAPFVEQRLLQLMKSESVEARVVAPVPWFPFGHERFGEYGVFARVPHEEVRNGVVIKHPRYVLLPKVSMSLAPLLMAIGAYRSLRRAQREGFDFDLIDAHFLYPDGMAAILLGWMLKKPVVITSRGSDVNLHLNYRFPRWLTDRLIRRAAALITVSEALKKRLESLFSNLPPITVLRNGVDLERFQPGEREQTRSELGLTGTTLISVGKLHELKGQGLTISALQQLPDATLLLVGEGPDREKLERLAESLGVSDRVRFLGSQPNELLSKFYCAADIMVLASSREGWANVLLESMACGTPVVATAVGGTPEVLRDPALGVLIQERSAAGIARAVRELLDRYPERALVRNYTSKFDWLDTSVGQMSSFRNALNIKN